MKTFFLAAMSSILAVTGRAQTTSVAGQYEQQFFLAPDDVKAAGGNLLITKDPALAKVVWVQNLVPGGRVKAILQLNNDGMVMYNIPAQRVGNYQVRGGCATYTPEDGKLMISLNNKINCFGNSQSDYDAGVSVSKNGRVKAGGVDVNGRNGSVKAPGVQVGGNGVRVDSKAVMAGVQYTGYKQGRAAKEDD